MISLYRIEGQDSQDSRMVIGLHLCRGESLTLSSRSQDIGPYFAVMYVREP